MKLRLADILPPWVKRNKQLFDEARLAMRREITVIPRLIPTGWKLLKKRWESGQMMRYEKCHPLCRCEYEPTI